jgi:penicillin-binding protein 1C
VWIEPRAVQPPLVGAGFPGLSEVEGIRLNTPRRILSARSAFWVTDVLSDPDARAYVFGRGGSLEFPFPVAAKTGTSQAYRDNWAVGYTRDVTVGVWVGNFDRRPLIGSSGVTGAGPLFHAVMLAAERRAARSTTPAGGVQPIVDPPGDLSEQTVCELSGMRAGSACPMRIRERLPSGFSPLPCDWHHASDRGLLTFWPVEYRNWAQRRGLVETGVEWGPASTGFRWGPASAFAEATADRPASTGLSGREATRPWRRRLAGSPRRVAEALAIAIPPNGSSYLIDPTLRAEFQTLPLRAVAARGRVDWHVDGRYQGSSIADRDLHWSLRPGEHRITVRDEGGRVAESVITVR